MRDDHRRIRLAGIALLLVAMCQVLMSSQVSAQAAGCADYSSASAAQFALDINPGLASVLDPDGNGIACDDASTGQSGTTGTDRDSTDLQLPDLGGPSPTEPANQGQGTDVTAVDQQPTGNTGTSGNQTPQTGGQQALDGRIGSSRAAWEQAYGAPIDEQAGSRPEIAIAGYQPVPSSSSFVSLWFNNQSYIILMQAETSWTGTDLAPIVSALLPSDITSIPDGETLSDGSLLIPMNSPELATAVTPEAMLDAGAPGVPGDLYLLLVTDSGDVAVEIEIGIGNGDNVREDVNGSTTTTTQPTVPTPTPVTTTTTTTTTNTNTGTFLQDTRTEVDTLLAEYDEFMSILAAGTFTDAEIDRMSSILSHWVTLDTSLPSAPPEHAALASQLQDARNNLSSGALQVITGLGSGDTSGFEQAVTLINTGHDSLLTIDQQLTALGV